MSDIIDVAKYRRKLEAKLANARHKQIKLYGDAPNHVCVFKDYKESIVSDNDKYNQGRAYFVVKVCSNCKKVKRTQLIIEP